MLKDDNLNSQSLKYIAHLAPWESEWKEIVDYFVPVLIPIIVFDQPHIDNNVREKFRYDRAGSEVWTWICSRRNMYDIHRLRIQQYRIAIDV